MRTILVTGGAGFIGSNLVYYLLKKYPDDRIVVLDALTYAGSPENLPTSTPWGKNAGLHFWYGNVCNGAIVETLVQDSDIVIHLAAETHVTRSIYDSLLFFQTDVIGTQTVANAILKARVKVKRFIHVSTSEVYGTARFEAMNEDHPLKPMSPYASAKCGADRLVYSYWATYQIPAVIVRPFNNYGPRQHLEKVVPRFITSVLLGEPLTVHGTGLSARDFLYVDDTCRGIDMLLSAPAELVEGEVFNLASGEHRSIHSIACDVADAMNYNRERIQLIGERPGQVLRHTGDWSKINKILNWKPQVSWQEGLKLTIKWYEDNRETWSKHLFMRRIPILTPSGKAEYH
jgi:dTDP-glucose 4,6-dehydratase